MGTNIAELRQNAHLPAVKYGSGNLAKFFAANKKKIESVLPRHMTPERMMRIAFNAITTTPKLAECSVESLMGAVIQSSILGLEPNTPLGQAYLVPFYNGKKRVKEVQFIIGYKGLIDLARRSGQIESINTHEVYSNDDFQFEYGLEEKLVHKPTWQADRGEMVGAYAVARFKDGGYVFEVMSVDQIKGIRDGSSGYKASKEFGFSSPWDGNFDEMARKTVIRRIAKYLPMSIELQDAVSLDNTADANVSQNLEGALEGDFNVVDRSDEGTPTNVEGLLESQGWFEDENGAKVNKHGEVWDPKLHATSSTEPHGPIVNKDGSFRTKRGAAKVAHKDEEPETTNEDGQGDAVVDPVPQEQDPPQPDEVPETDGYSDDDLTPPMDLD